MFYEGVYKIAEHVFLLKTQHQYTHTICSDYKSSDTPTFEICITKDDVDYERKKSSKEAEFEGIASYDFKDSYLESLSVLRKLSVVLLQDGYILFHGSAIALDGKTYIFTAKSGTGKSTHTRFWLKTFGDRCIMVNDDKPILKVTSCGVKAFGSPWCGKHKLGNNVSFDVKAILSLHRGENNKVFLADRKELFGLLLQQTHRPEGPENMAKLLPLVDKLSCSVELYNIYCNLNENSALEIYSGMKG